MKEQLQVPRLPLVARNDSGELKTGNDSGELKTGNDSGELKTGNDSGELKTGNDSGELRTRNDGADERGETGKAHVKGLMWQPRELEVVYIMPVETVAAAHVTNDVHAWEAGGASSPEALAAWVGARLAAHEAALAALLAVEGPRTIENTLRLYDAAIEHLALAGAQAGVLNSVAADKAVRDQAQMEAQRVAMAGSALSLNRGVYDALVAMDLTDASAATRHLWSGRCWVIGWPAWTRTRRRAIGCRRCTRRRPWHSLDFSRNIQEGGKTIVATQAELDGLPPDYMGRHQPDASGQITLTTDQPDMQPVMTFASNAGSARADVSWRTTRGLIRRTSKSCLTCCRRGRRLLRCLGFGAGPIWRPRTR